ncbi:hypothetical protein ACIA5C_46450 [Actinoplanes sp. NPDC051343]|uniref:hypothetical protein n=1 Tax=Actinoplanes sp. NPDC051343 TaxID=3363906 RepID=UPI0037A26ACD
MRTTGIRAHDHAQPWYSVDQQMVALVARIPYMPARDDHQTFGLGDVAAGSAVATEPVRQQAAAASRGGHLGGGPRSASAYRCAEHHPDHAASTADSLGGATTAPYGH